MAPTQSYSHPELGQFEIDPNFETSFSKEIEWLADPVSLRLCFISVSLDDETEVDREAVAADACEILRDKAGWQARLDDILMQRVFLVWVQEWREGAQSIPDRSRFLAELKLVAIYVYGGGYIEFEIDGGALFDGNFIMATGDVREGFDDAGVAG